MHAFCSGFGLELNARHFSFERSLPQDSEKVTYIIINLDGSCQEDIAQESAILISASGIYYAH